ncbi:MAG: ATP-binding protein [Planctomycetaceae bacterium]
MSIIAADITQSREIEREIERTRSLAQSTLNSLNECIAIIDETGNILSVNVAWHDFLEELNLEQFHLDKGHNFYAVQSASSDLLWRGIQEISERTKALFNDHDHEAMDSFIFFNETSNLWFSIKINKFLEEDEARVVIAIDDITPLKQAHLEIQRVARAAESANIAKTDFLTNMSHEIRTPLTSILGFTELMVEEQMDAEEQSRALQTIRRNGDHLLGIINEILDLSKIESGKLEVEVAPCDVVQLIDDLDDIMTLRAEKMDLSYRTEFVTPIPASIKTDATRLKQVLFNLLGNATKFTREGEIVLRVSLEAAPLGFSRLRFEVQDSGIGIAPDKIHQLFEPFTQADNSVSREYGGTGLGLAISKRLAKLLGGEIGADSTPGEGSTFWFTIGVGKLESQETVSSLSSHRNQRQLEVQDEEDFHNLHCSILLAEDGADNQRLFQYILSRAGVRLTMVNNGADAVEKASDPSNHYDFILMDMQMPIMDGYAATRKLREMGYTKPILALTAHAVRSMQRRCKQAGCDDVITKPIERKQLLSTLTRWHSKSFELS